MLLFGLFTMKVAMYPIMWPLAFLVGGVKDLFVYMDFVVGSTLSV